MNIILITIDTLRADHLGCYGYARNTSPNIDAFADDAVVFDRMIAPAIPTHPAFSTLLTGQYPITHGVVAHGGDNEVQRNAPWLPSLLQKGGYSTCAVDNLADWSSSFRRGFEYYIDPTQKQVLGLCCTNRDLNKRAIPWLEHHKDETFFMMIHYWDPHTPYLPPRAYRTLYYDGDPCDPAHTSLAGMEDHPLGVMWRENWFNKLGGHVTDAEYITALYDGEIRYCDEGVGQLLKAVDQCGLRDDTLVVIMGDHGELMYRHGIFFDHHGLYDGNLRVPLIVRGPDLAAKRVAHLAEHVDVAPTLLSLAGQDIPETIEGVDLAPMLRGDRDEPVRDFVVSAECTWQVKWSIRTDTHKFILAREPDAYNTPLRELYDLTTDPDELHNIADTHPDLAAKLEHELETWIAEKMRANALTEDPLSTHGVSLGKIWKEERGEE
jgi:arylsulfatase A-like enzyme